MLIVVQDDVGSSGGGGGCLGCKGNIYVQYYYDI